MPGRNDPCSCGSGRKYKKCCERVVAIKAAESARDVREGKQKSGLLNDLYGWYEKQLLKRNIDEWTDLFKREMGLSLHAPLPESLYFAYHYWMIFDTPCFAGRRPVQCWAESFIPQKWDKPVVEDLCSVHLTYYEVMQVQGSRVRLYAPLSQDYYTVYVAEPLQEEMLVFARLSRLGNRYQMIGPYTLFRSSLKEEILLHIRKNAERSGESESTYWERHRLQVVGWSLQRAQERGREERENKESTLISSPSTQEQRRLLSPPLASETGLSDGIAEQLSRFYSEYVSTLQERTRNLYQQTLDWLCEYISSYFGLSFHWNSLDEKALLHFLAVWYPQVGPKSAVRAKIFLNTLKQLFRWLDQVKIGPVYTHFRPLYHVLIGALPAAFEAKNWMIEESVGTDPVSSAEENRAGIFRVDVTATGPVAWIDGKMAPVKSKGLPSPCVEMDFWVQGVLRVVKGQVEFERLERVYPMMAEESASQEQLKKESWSR
ncbi:SEC-C metal-binding domain-containing protein [Mechercharimyces sp. CAU 1602]|uniref:SEC-C metal-binding domain-containing protein n=1 Tax=Mechercharimyces sp. CAU 1602 TaxID=2973933 RepID=UPI0021615A35|nr:SEC-C metal-binding domain-containing protein [Mechercharimyces sp. CAU 1602]MCS1350561.1 SEC-C metal-binding domain-containing protein [Mechercharimyces sp. CAU 1602]